ncbi:hypothetical protein C8J56DRAFT_897678 [Mycena floridula]|nr:hypothetical protein C8J56DRAFT_897678 [Mycena floridula]
MRFSTFFVALAVAYSSTCFLIAIAALMGAGVAYLDHSVTVTTRNDPRPYGQHAAFENYMTVSRWIPVVGPKYLGTSSLFLGFASFFSQHGADKSASRRVKIQDLCDKKQIRRKVGNEECRKAKIILRA